MAGPPRISEAEWGVMRVLWERAPRTANEVVEAVLPARDWSPRTVKTLLNRLVKKRALGFRREGRAYLYFPRVSEAECVRAESRSFVDRVFGGSLTPMLAHFIEEHRLSDREIAELRRLLEARGDES